MNSRNVTNHIPAELLADIEKIEEAYDIVNNYMSKRSYFEMFLCLFSLKHSIDLLNKSANKMAQELIKNKMLTNTSIDPNILYPYQVVYENKKGYRSKRILRLIKLTIFLLQLKYTIRHK